MARFHINKKGEPGACYARYNCPLGGADEHYDSKEDAARAYETKMVAALIPEGASKDELGLKELNELAKVSTDKEVIFNALSKGSERTLANLAKNPSLSSEILLQAYDKAGKDSTKLAFESHPNFPVDRISPENIAGVIYGSKITHDRSRAILESNSITDAHVDALTSYLSKIDGIYKRNHLWLVLKNPNNQLSVEKVKELGETNFTTIGAAMESNRYPAEEIEYLDKNLVYWGNIDKTDNAEYLNGYAAWAVRRQLSYEHEAEYTASRIASNPATSPATLQTLAENGLALASVYKHPHADTVTKEMAKNISPEVARIAKIEELDKNYPNGLKNELIVADHTNQPYRNRGIYDSSIMLNVDKVKELGLTREDIYTLMNARSYNGGVSYNEETGVFRATLDSTD